MHRHLRRPAYTSVPALLLLALAFLAAATPAAAECDVSICQGDPCTITGMHFLDDGCGLDFSGQDVTLAPQSALVLLGSADLSARNFTVQGKIQGKPLLATISVTEDFRIEDRGRLLGTRVKENSSVVTITVGGDMIIAGATNKVGGDYSAIFEIQAGGNVQVDASIKARASFEGFADIEFSAGGSITTTKGLSAKGGLTSGATIVMEADGDITVNKPLKLASGRLTGEDLAVLIGAGGNVTLDRVQLSSQLLGGRVDVSAGGDITLQKNVSARGFKGSELVGEGAGGQVSLDPGPTGIVRLPKRVINASCSPGCETPGSIQIEPACYTDVTGARFFARTGGDISLGCTCAHPTGSNVCDGGCQGLDTASFDPPIPTVLPPCS